MDFADLTKNYADKALCALSRPWLRDDNRTLQMTAYLAVSHSWPNQKSYSLHGHNVFTLACSVLSELALCIRVWEFFLAFAGLLLVFMQRRLAEAFHEMSKHVCLICS